jgi:hypothetical protein
MCRFFFCQIFLRILDRNFICNSFSITSPAGLKQTWTFRLITSFRRLHITIFTSQRRWHNASMMQLAGSYADTNADQRVLWKHRFARSAYSKAGQFIIEPPIVRLKPSL